MTKHTQVPASRRRLLMVLTTACIAMVLAAPLLVAQRGNGAPVGRAAPRVDRAEAARLAVEDAAVLVDAVDRNLNYLPGEVLVKFRPGTSVAGQSRALAGLRSRPQASALRWLGGPIARLRDMAEPDAERLAALLRRQPEVEFAQPNYLRPAPRSVEQARTRAIRVGAAPTRIPNDPSFSELQWNLRLIEAPGAWAINPGGAPAISVAVLDTGLTVENTTVTRRLWTGQQFEQIALPFVISPDLDRSRLVLARDEAFEPGRPPFDMDGHGTHVASTIAEEANNAFGLAGLAYRVRLMPVKVCLGFWDLMLMRADAGVTGYVPSDAGSCSDADIIAGINYAVDSGANVINLSLGGSGSAPAVRDALLNAVSRGVFVAAAAGNGFESGNLVDYPAGYARDIEGLVAVGAIGKSKSRAYYSNTGTHVELAAPGGSSRDDDGGEDQGFVWQVTLYPDEVDPLETSRPRFDRYGEIGYTGTSMATPHVSALAALLISQGVTRPRDIESVMRSTALDLGPVGKDTQFGDGLIQARRALFGLGATR